MMSETITRNDLKAILDEVLLPTSILLVEKKNLTFSSGVATVTGKSGYYLANAYITGRSVGEHAYSITDINQDTSGNYTLSNKNTGLNASATFVLIWVKEGGNNTSSVDCIVEQGTTGIWTYRKWQSGIAECWGEYYKSVSASTTDNNNYVQFPFTFTATPIVNVGLKAGGAAYYSAHAENGSTNTTQARITFVNNYSGVVDMYAELIVKGRWK